jgi:ABC-type antimicrobial peptide transport system permease subunit
MRWRAYRELDSDAPIIYVPSTQHPDFGESRNLFVRAENTAEIARAVQNEVLSHGHEYSKSAKTLAETNDEALGEDRATALLSSLFGALALTLASIGLFGLMSYMVTRRTREIGVRVALGSQPAAILRLVIRESLLLSVAGLIIGAPCAIATTRLMAHMLFGVTPGDPLILALASSALLAVGAVAGYWPARRAAKIDPMVALRVRVGIWTMPKHDRVPYLADMGRLICTLRPGDSLRAVMVP